MELRKFAVSMLVFGLLISGTFIFLGGAFTSYGVTNNVENSSLSRIVVASEGFQNNATEIYSRTASGQDDEEFGALDLLNLMVYGVYKTVVYTGNSLFAFTDVAKTGFSDTMPDSQIIPMAISVIVSIILVTIAFLIANAVFKWRI